MKKLLQIIKRNKLSLISACFFVVAMLLLAYGPIIIDKTIENKNNKSYAEKHYEFEGSFDLSKVPSGYVIWRHGVPKYPMDFIHGDSATMYEYFDVGILDNNNGIVYQVRVPFYAIVIFREEYINTDKYRNKKKMPPLPKKIPPKKEENLKENLYKQINL
jgi:hypothetical protein